MPLFDMISGDETPNKLAAPNAAMTSLFQSRFQWRGIGEPGRWAVYARFDPAVNSGPDSPRMRRGGGSPT